MRVDHLRVFYAQGINSVQIPKDDFVDFKAWVSSGKYQLKEVRNKGFDVVVSDYHSFSTMLAHDSSRFCSAAFETMKLISFPENLPRSLAWVAVQTYYAAFFAAHSVLRVFGNVFSFLYPGHLKIVEEFAEVLSIPSRHNMSGGSYSGSYDIRSGELRVSSAGKSHEDFWERFFYLVMMLRDQVDELDVLESEKINNTKYLSEMVDLLSNSGSYRNGAWLSSVRNKINYQHTDGMWFPYSGGNHDIPRIRRILGQWEENNSSYILNLRCVSDMERFFKCCTLIVNFSYLIFQDVVSISRVKKNCFEMYPGALINHAG
ncbi:hypothetical protein [Halomonas rhizosphaerae]|uniref:Uncharacterized protein n=1 Tax=Halomonas rhizosphaerae TaxID=3043296 RepID=A0ABT6V5L0_9GAMM|nr:hypothetical protein [Halomonas rhizosphaerae]MDI5893060.1 hypothetical protein [Halomonas rhizosphaerae]